MAAENFPQSNVRVGEYNAAQWSSIFDLRFDEGYLQELNRYGIGSYFFDFLKLAGQMQAVTNRNPKVFERLEWESTVKIGAAIAVGAAGADISIVVHADDQDAAGNVPIQVSDGIVIPAYYEATKQNRIYVIHTYNPGTFTATASPLSADGTTITESEIAIEVPTDIELKIHANFFGYGTGQPRGTYDAQVTREYPLTIIKTSMDYEGGIQAIKWRELKTDSGINSVWIEGQERAELQHSKKMDDAIFLGELNDNATLTQASNFGGTNKRASNIGLWNWGEQAGQELLYGGQWAMSNLYDYKDLALSQNLVANDIWFGLGTDLQRMVEEANLDWIREYSGGSDLFRTSSEIGVGIKYAHVNGYMFQFQEIKSFANPLRYGNKYYDFSKYGIMIPDAKQSVTIEGRTEYHPNISLGYLNHGGENRERVLRLVDGMTGRNQLAVNDIDGSHLYILSEFTPLVFRPNQIVLVKQQ